MSSFRDMRKRSSESERHRARHRVGGRVQGDEAEDKKLIKREVKASALKRADGGKVTGAHAPKNLGFARGGRVKLKTGGAVHNRIANLGHYAHGGKVKAKGKGGGKKAVTNVIIAPQGGGGGLPPRPMPAPPMAGKPPMPPGAGASPPPGGAPPMPPPGAGPMMPPPGGMPPKPPGMAARGGRIALKRGGAVKPQAVSAKMKGGAGGGQGRLDKERIYGA